MAEIDLTIKTTQVVIVSAFVILTIYYNFILVKSSLEILFWATITSFPLIGLKNSTEYISPYLANLNKFKKHHILLFGGVFGKIILYDQNKKAIIFSLLIILYIFLEKTLRKNDISNFIKLSIVTLLFSIIIIAFLNSILHELKFMVSNFHIKNLVSEKNLSYVNDLVTPNLEKMLKGLKWNNNVFLKLKKCGINCDQIGITDIMKIKFSESYYIIICLFKEYKKQIITIAKTSHPVIIKGLKKFLDFGEHSFSAITKFMTFSSTVYIMTRQSIHPMQVVDAFLTLIDESGYLSMEFKDIVNSLIVYNFQKLLVTSISTFLTFSLFSMNIIAIPTILSALTILVPGSPAYLIPLIGILENLFLKKTYCYIILFVVAHNRIKVYCDKMITLKVSLINSKKYILGS